MADPKGQEEPSMEEILASIRRIISEDDEEEGKPAEKAGGEPETAEPVSEPAEAPQPEPVVEAAPEPVAESEPEPAPVAEAEPVAAAPASESEPEPVAADDDDVLELTEMVDEEGNVVTLDDAEPMPEPIEEFTEPVEPLPAEPDEGLVERLTEDAVAASLGTLSGSVTPPRADLAAQRIQPGGRTIEEHVLEMLRPMLQDWLDQHLPQMVQRLVQREIDRIAHRSDPI